MRITNRLGLPQAFVRAVENDPYENNGTLSVTTLIRPPQMVRLLKEHADEVTEDAADRVWAILGQAGHAALERSAQDGDIVETRFYMNVDGYEVSGQLDRLTKDGVLVDWKFTSVYAIKDALRNGKSEWEQQLNMLAALVSHQKNWVGNLPDPKALRIIAVARDWRPSEKLRDPDYPNKVEVIKIPLWTHERAMEFIKERVRLHTSETYPPCSDEERWASDEKWAVMEKGRKKAHRLLDSEEQARKWAHENDLGFVLPDSLGNYENVLKKGVTIGLRPREYKRCEEYCSAKNFCPQYKKDREAAC
jgi:hypothetical protein